MLNFISWTEIKKSPKNQQDTKNSSAKIFTFVAALFIKFNQVLGQCGLSPDIPGKHIASLTCLELYKVIDIVPLLINTIKFKWMTVVLMNMCSRNWYNYFGSKCFQMKSKLKGKKSTLHLKLPISPNWPREVIPMDPTFVFHAFYYFTCAFLTIIFFNCPTIGYAPFDAKKFKSTPLFSC